jgi:hypothetical protein
MQDILFLYRIIRKIKQVFMDFKAGMLNWKEYLKGWWVSFPDRNKVLKQPGRIF